MQNCPLCDGNLVTKTSSTGPEIYCGDCRNIIYSSTLRFTAAPKTEVEICEKDGLPGVKGPGEKARCWTYTNDEEKQIAQRKAEASAYQNKKAAHIASLVNTLDRQVIFATPFMTGAPDIATGGAGSNALAGMARQRQTQKPPAVSTIPPTEALAANPGTMGGAAPAGAGVTVPGITPVQPPAMQNNNGAISTLSSRKLAELAVELESTAPRVNQVMKDSLGPSFCTSHNIYDSCSDN